MTFKEQAHTWINKIGTRRKDPVRPSTVERYRYALDILNPSIGNLDLTLVGNKVAKELVESLTLSPASIAVVLYVLKAVVKSAVDAEGNQLYPRTWNSVFIEAPTVNPKEQKAPQLALEALQRALGAPDGLVRGVSALLAGSGVRINTLLTLTVGPDDGQSNHWDIPGAVLNIRHDKTEAGTRLVDLAPELNEYLVKTLKPNEGPLFPMSKRTLGRRMKAVANFSDFHRFRRFRVTHLDKQNVPDGLKKFWIGHAAEDVTGRYISYGSEIETRKEWARKAGLGFGLEAV